MFSTPAGYPSPRRPLYLGFGLRSAALGDVPLAWDVDGPRYYPERGRTAQYLGLWKRRPDGHGGVAEPCAGFEPRSFWLGYLARGEGVSCADLVAGCGAGEMVFFYLATEMVIHADD